MRTRRRTAKRTKSYASIQAWMEATGTNQAQLARLVGVKPSHVSNVLSKSRRASLYLALKLHRVTGVPVDIIAGWPAKYEETAK